MYDNSNLIEAVFKSNDVLIRGDENTENSVRNYKDETPVYIRSLVASPSAMLVDVEAVLMSIICMSTEDNEEFVVFCNCRYADVKNTKVFDEKYKVGKVWDCPEKSVFSFGAIKELIAQRELTEDKKLNFNIGIISSDSDHKAFPLNNEFVDITGVSLGEDAVVLVHNANDIIKYQMDEAAELAKAQEGADDSEPVIVDAEDSEPIQMGEDEPAKVIDASDKFVADEETIDLDGVETTEE